MAFLISLKKEATGSDEDALTSFYIMELVLFTHQTM